MYGEVAESGSNNINDGIKCGENCTELTVNKHNVLVGKNSSEAANTPTKVCDKPLLNQNAPQCVDILKKTVIGLPWKNVIGSFKK